MDRNQERIYHCRSHFNIQFELLAAALLCEYIHHSLLAAFAVFLELCHKEKKIELIFSWNVIIEVFFVGGSLYVLGAMGQGEAVRVKSWKIAQTYIANCFLSQADKKHSEIFILIEFFKQRLLCCLHWTWRRRVAYELRHL